MEVKQIYTLTNEVVKEVLGEETVVNEDLSNLVDVGEALFNASAVENYTKTLVDHIGRMVFVVRKYTGSAPSVIMDSWEYGSVMEKVRAEMPEAQENESWELEDGASYDENIFKAPKVSAKFFNKRTTFEIQLSITDEQVKSAFTDAGQMNSFISMLYNEVDKALQVRTDELVMRTINHHIACTLKDGNEVRACNLLALYNAEHEDAPLTAETCLKNKEFIRFVALTLKLYASRMAKMSKLYNIGGTAKFTPRDYLHLVMLADFKVGADIYLQSETFHNELSKLPDAEEVPFWQGSGTGYGFEDISKIDVKTAFGDTVTQTGIIACMFDREALGVSNFKRHVTSKYNARAEFTNLWYKQFAGYFNDLDENFVVFFVADEE